MDLRLLADAVENPGNRERIDEAASLLGGHVTASVEGRLIAVENSPSARPVYGSRPGRGTVTLAVGNERRGLSRALLNAAEQTLIIPTLSRTVTTLNVAAAAAVAGWYVKHGSGPQARAPHPERRRPAVLLSGDDHIEVGSSLRSAAAFGYREVYLDDRGAGWFDGEHHKRREARAAARRHKNPLRVRRPPEDLAARFDEVLLISATESATPISRACLARGRRQLIVIGAPATDDEWLVAERARTVALGLNHNGGHPGSLRLVASIALAEISRQVGQPATKRATPPPRGPRYERELALVADGEMLLVEHEDLLAF